MTMLPETFQRHEHLFLFQIIVFVQPELIYTVWGQIPPACMHPKGLQRSTYAPMFHHFAKIFNIKAEFQIKLLSIIFSPVSFVRPLNSSA